jgi:hypothetical protein
VQSQEFTYPPYSIPLVEAYGGLFESVFIVLHPFVRVPDSLAWSATHQYPSDAQILTVGSKVPWAEVAAPTGLANCARIHQALLTSIGSLSDHLADPDGRDALKAFLESQPVWMPVEGRFEPLLQADFLQTFAETEQAVEKLDALKGHDFNRAAKPTESTGPSGPEGCFSEVRAKIGPFSAAREAAKLIFVPEFPQSDPVATLSIAGLSNGSVPFPARGTLLAPDHSFLFTVDWDSFFTLFYGSRSFITRVAAALNLEGFFASPNTEHAWFNYSFGCATITISPEHWQTA